jgi:hypothetical protein
MPSRTAASRTSPDTLDLMVAWLMGASEPDNGRLSDRARAPMAATSAAASSYTSGPLGFLSAAGAALAAAVALDFDCITVQPPPAKASTTRTAAGARHRLAAL